MARLSQIGFELNSVTSGIEAANLGTGQTIDSTTFRTGAHALKAIGTNSASMAFQWQTSKTTGPFYMRFYVNIASATNGTTVIGSDLDTVIKIKITTANKLQLFNGASQIGSDSPALSTNTWYRVEIKYDGTAGAGAVIIEAKIDGSTFATSSAETLATGIRGLKVGINLSFEGKTGTFYFDDLAMNDSTGSFQTGYPGVGQIIHMLPDSAGDSASWTRAGTDTGANYSQVNEVTPDDTGTSVTTSTLNQEDLHNLAASPSSIGSSDTINVVAVGIRFVGSGGSGNPTLKVEIEASAAGTIEQSAGISPGITYRTNNTDANLICVPPLILYDLPGASTTPWTKADLDTAQIGYKETTDTANTLNISTVWLSVDSTPAAGGSTTFIIPQRMRMGMGA